MSDESENPTPPAEQASKKVYKTSEEASRIYLLPNSMTAGNLFFGFLAIILCIKANFDPEPAITKELYIKAVWCILAAVVCDALDGRLARLGGKESLFGAEFDSIADTVSFGLAPALLVFFLILSPENHPFFARIGWIIGFIYLLCAAVRLARFNVITSPLLPPHEKLKNSKDFLGLPVPAAAGLIASLVFVITNYDLKGWALGLPFLMLLIAFLMVSNVQYPSFKNIDWHTQLRLRTFIGGFVFIVALFHFYEIAFSIVFMAYIIGGAVNHALRLRRASQFKARGHKNETIGTSSEQSGNKF
ncbi:MAG: CDP-diacylglycerol--serine O-phosphatidyltransferase [Opitutales bacterium]